MVGCNPSRHARLDLHFLCIGLPLHLVACLELLLGIDAGRCKHLHGLGPGKLEEHFRDRGLGVKSPACSFLLPLIAVAVAVEADDVDDGCDNRLEGIHNGDFKRLARSKILIEGSLELPELLGYRCIEGGHGTCTVGRGAHGTELETVAGKCKRRCAVAVGIVHENLRYFDDSEALALLAGNLDRSA